MSTEEIAPFQVRIREEPNKEIWDRIEIDVVSPGGYELASLVLPKNEAQFLAESILSYLAKDAASKASDGQ